MWFNNISDCVTGADLIAYMIYHYSDDEDDKDDDDDDMIDLQETRWL